MGAWSFDFLGDMEMDMDMNIGFAWEGGGL